MNDPEMPTMSLTLMALLLGNWINENLGLLVTLSAFGGGGVIWLIRLEATVKMLIKMQETKELQIFEKIAGIEQSIKETLKDLHMHVTDPHLHVNHLHMRSIETTVTKIEAEVKSNHQSVLEKLERISERLWAGRSET